jgi:hypothetical protein
VTLFLGNNCKLDPIDVSPVVMFDFIGLTILQPKFFSDLWTFIVGTGFEEQTPKVSP